MKKTRQHLFTIFAVLILISIVFLNISNHRKDIRPNKSLSDYIDVFELSDYNIITVDKEDSADFTTITDAINHARKSTNNIVYIKSGIYEENLYLTELDTTLILIGEDKRNTQLVSYDDNYYNAPLAISGNAIIANLNIEASYKEGADTEENELKTYALHIDYPGEGKLMFLDCTFVSEYNSSVGIGMHSNQEIVFENSLFHSRGDHSGFAFYLHNNVSSGILNQEVTVINSRFHSDSSSAFRLDDSNQIFGDGVGNDMTVTLIDNAFTSGNRKERLIHFYNPANNDDCLSGSIKLSEKSKGNNFSLLNYHN